MASKHYVEIDRAINQGDTNLALRMLLDDLKRKDEVIAALLAKLDADSADTGGDSDYSALDDE